MMNDRVSDGNSVDKVHASRVNCERRSTFNRGLKFHVDGYCAVLCWIYFVNR